jgi:uncharacterized RDD family membrane protein YckC
MASVPSSGTSAPPPPVWDAQAAGTAQVAYGGFWIRLLAYIIDAVILGIAGGILGAIFGISMMSSSNVGDYNPALNIVSLVIAWLYFALFESSARGATPGKMALGLRVVTGDGQRLSFLNATGRYFAKFISAIILCIGFIMIGFTERKRGLHDMMANTLVIKVR